MSVKPTEQALSFLQVYTQVSRDRMKHSFLRQINACVDWRGILTLLSKKCTKTQNAIGNPAYDALLMFKILLLETWYGLSDYMDKLLRRLNKQFKKHGISRIDQGAIVDASIVDSPHAPDGSMVIEVAEDREDNRSEEAQTQEQAYHCELQSSKPGVDSEARWVRKGKRYRYGYKKHVLTDEQGLVEALITTPANCADTVVLPDLIEKSELVAGVSVLANKGYSSKKTLNTWLVEGLLTGLCLRLIVGKLLVIARSSLIG